MARNEWRLLAIVVGYVVYTGLIDGIVEATVTLGRLLGYLLIVAVILSLPAWFRLLRRIVIRIVK